MFKNLRHKLRLPQIERFLLRLDKRVRFVASTLILSGLMLFSTFTLFDKAWIFIPLLIITSYILTYICIIEGVEKIEWWTLFIMPVALSVAFYVFYFLFPVRWLTRIPFIAIYAIAIYAILLTSNIFNVGAEKNIQLYRAAFSVNYFFQTVVMFLALNILFSLKLSFWINTLAVGATSLPLSFQVLWSIRLKHELESYIIYYGAFLALIMAEGALVFSFVPWEASIFALLLTAAYYAMVGIIYSHIDQRLFKQTLRGYLFVMVFVFAIALLTLKW